MSRIELFRTRFLSGFEEIIVYQKMVSYKISNKSMFRGSLHIVLEVIEALKGFLKSYFRKRQLYRIFVEVFRNF